ncbi:MAG TPA: NAD kinase [Saprospiraceae bacterium]|nr:NAD kinase [Saprospiraceae bacterium]HMQ84114.1 NAD kinase [Saprospiraceae bacterium]
MQVVVYSKILKEEDIPFVQALFDGLQEENIQAHVFRPYLEQIKDHIHFRAEVGCFEGYMDIKKQKYDFFVTMGGDGTILAALAHVRDAQVPILGINLGRLGFLASIEKKRIREALNLVKRGMYEIEERGMLYLESNIPIFGELRFALNDCTLLKRDTSSMITIHTYINGSYLNSYWADGIIVATPTGSTGYSLSCGGPVVFPDSGNFVITPVAPHNLNVRPIVISDDSVISFQIEGRAENFLCTLDSRFEPITSEHQLAVRKNDFNMKLVQLQGIGFMETLRSKLTWGIDSRNH